MARIVNSAWTTKGPLRPDMLPADQEKVLGELDEAERQQLTDAGVLVDDDAEVPPELEAQHKQIQTSITTQEEHQKQAKIDEINARAQRKADREGDVRISQSSEETSAERAEGDEGGDVDTRTRKTSRKTGGGE